MGRAVLGGGFASALCLAAACGGESTTEGPTGTAGHVSGAGQGPSGAGRPSNGGKGGSSGGTGAAGGGGRSQTGKGGASGGPSSGGTSNAGEAGSGANAGASGATLEAGAGGAAGVGPSEPSSNPERDIQHTALDVALDSQTALATITIAPSPRAGATFEIGNLDIASVEIGGAKVAFAVHGSTVDVAVPRATKPIEVTIAYGFSAGGRGWSGTGYTLTWPYYCGDLFPCHSAPSEGTTFDLHVASAGDMLVYPAKIPADVPAYVAAWAQGNYVEQKLGETLAGTKVSVFYLPDEAGGLADAEAGTTRLRDAFEWY